MSPSLQSTNKIYPPSVYTDQFSPPTLQDFVAQKFGASSVVDLKKYTLVQLKAFAQYYKLHITGTKPILYDRIIEFFTRSRAALTIQRVFRGWIVRRAVALRAVAWRGDAVNETDFYTLEPVRDIPYLMIYGFTDENAHLFVFHIQSMTTLIMRGGGLDNEPINPYTREKIPDRVIAEVLQYIRLQRILWPEIELLQPSLYKFLWGRSRAGAGGISVIQKLYAQQQILQKLYDIRQKSDTQRAVALFAEIDLLGNYTSADWFLNLSIKEVYFYWNILYDLWLYRAGILADTKMQICPLHAPFEGKNLSQMTDLTYGVVIDATLYAMENMVYMSDNEEYRKLGCMYVLMALTVVSPEARAAFPYLFENIAY